MYLTAVMDWHSRYVLSWRLSNTLEVDFCLEALEAALWRTVKYEEIYLWHYETVPALQTGLAKYFDSYNRERRHQSLDERTPGEVYEEGRRSRKR